MSAGSSQNSKRPSDSSELGRSGDRRTPLLLGVLSLLAGLWSISPLSAQGDGEPRRPNLRAVAAESVPVLDGDVLSDLAWVDAPVGSGFTQVEPTDGAPASERTEVRVLYSSDTLYIGVVCYDDEPEKLIINDTRRDSSLSSGDSFRVILDTFRDGQNGFIFGTNPGGMEYDVQVMGGGGSGGFGSRRGGSGYNLDWNTSWQVEVTVGDFGWSAELAIPFRSLRFPSATSQTWGLNVERRIGRRNERAYWSQLERQYFLTRVSDAGALTAIQVPRQRNLTVTPYVLGSARERGEDIDEQDFEAGVEMKYGVTGSLSLDLTYNTDFAQVEADDQQINLNRFNLFFPEKRPFFLENAGLFSVGSPGSVELFFSRRIGIESGAQVPILGGARLSGKAGGFNVGMLAMQTDETGDRQGNRFTVGRVARELDNRSRVGAIFVQRDGTGALAADGDMNRTVGVDGKWGIGRFLDLSGFAAATETPGVESDEHAYSVAASWSSPGWRWGAGFLEIGDGFNPEVGFLARRGYRRPSVFVQRRIRRPEGRILEISPRVFWADFRDFDGFQETEFLFVGGDIRWRSGFNLSLSASANTEGLKSAFQIAPNVVVPVAVYDETETRLTLRTSRAKALSGEVTVREGGFFGGDRTGVSGEVSWRLGDKVTSSLRWDNNDVTLPGGAFATNLGRLRVTYSFSTKLFLEGLVQYNDLSGTVSSNVRFSWLQRANTGLFVVYNDQRETGFDASPPDRSLIVKYSYLIDVFR